MQFVKSSKNKHESDIPEADIDNVTMAFSASRKKGIALLHSKTNVAGSNALAPIYELYLSVTTGTWSQQLERTMFRLEKQFVIRGDMSFEQSALDASNKLFLFSITSHYLLKNFQLKQDFNGLNSAIRINDAIIKHLDMSDFLFEQDFVEESYHVEADILRELNNVF